MSPIRVRQILRCSSNQENSYARFTYFWMCKVQPNTITSPTISFALTPCFFFPGECQGWQSSHLTCPQTKGAKQSSVPSQSLMLADGCRPHSIRHTQLLFLNAGMLGKCCKALTQRIHCWHCLTKKLTASKWLGSNKEDVGIVAKSTCRNLTLYTENAKLKWRHHASLLARVVKAWQPCAFHTLFLETRS